MPTKTKPVGALSVSIQVPPFEHLDTMYYQMDTGPIPRTRASLKIDLGNAVGAAVTSVTLRFDDPHEAISFAAQLRDFAYKFKQLTAAELDFATAALNRDPEICSTCCGSGEGLREGLPYGTRCSDCGGSGEADTRTEDELAQAEAELEDAERNRLETAAERAAESS